MYKYFIYLFLFINILYAQNIDTLLQEYEYNTKKSLKTVDEKLGHVTIYSQKDLKLMQYTTLADLLKELPLTNLNKNKYGVSSLSISGTKTDVSGFFRFFINDHEVSSSYTQSPSNSWIELPLDFIDYIEVYRGNSSFALGSENGIFFIRIYTKKPFQENASQIATTVASHGTNSQSVTHSETFQSGWSYLSYFNKTKVKDSNTYKGNRVGNDADQRYFYLNIQKNNTDINFGYTDLSKENYLGLALDANSDNGEIDSKDYFIDIKNYFLDDKSIKVQISYDNNDIKINEQDSGGLALIPVLDFTNLGGTIPKESYHDSSVSKFNTLITKTISHNKNNFLIGANFQDKKYTTHKNTIVNFANVTSDVGQYTSFDREKTLSLLLQDDYKVNEELLLVANGKFDKFKRNGNLDDFSDEQYRIGAIYTPFNNFGLKAFYTETYITPTFYNVDYADKNNDKMKSQQYKYYAIKGVYAKDNSKFSLLYSHINIENFIYYTPVGFINVDYKVNTEGLIFDYSYEFSQDNKIQLNYYITKLSRNFTNSYKGGYVKYMGKYQSFEYFTSLIYRNSYRFLDAYGDKSFNFNIGATYNISKDSSISLKAENLLDKSTQLLFQEGFNGANFALDDYQRKVTLSMKWVF